MNKPLINALFGVWLTLSSSAYCHGDITATGTRPEAGHTAAVSRDLEPLMGRHIYVASRGGWYHVEDRMARRWRQTIDLRMEDEAVCDAWGRRPVWVWVGDKDARSEGRNPH